MNHLYPRLAVTNLKNNKLFYFPYLMTGMASVMMFYIMRAMQGDESISGLRGFSYVKMVLSMGLAVVGICACIFLFYTNSFVVKRRKKEFGVYHILGMEKKHIARVMLWETILLSLASILGGLLLGILFHKLAAMFLYKLTGLSESIPFYISGFGCLQTAFLFAIFYLLLLFYNVIQVKRTNPIALLHASSVGEREPKAKWLTAILGLFCILTGYFLAISVSDVAIAVSTFFIAVILVIIGTYALFTAVSIAFLKLLKKNRRYYYKTSHFISVSGMLYRMKRNAVGLASICILSTMVLVMVSSTVCLYAGLEDSLQYRYDKEISAELYFDEMPDASVKQSLREQIQQTAKKQNRCITSLSQYSYLLFMAYKTGNSFEMNPDTESDLNGNAMLYTITWKDYEMDTGKKTGPVAPGTVMLASSNEFEGDVVRIFGKSYPVAGKTDLPDSQSKAFLGNIDLIYAIVADENELKELWDSSCNSPDDRPSLQYHVKLDIDGTREEQKSFAKTVQKLLEDNSEPLGFHTGLIQSRAQQREEYFELNGGFLFLGLFLGSLFLMITVLIIYYKQISEGFEDRERFSIMVKVGMSQDTVKAAIHTQVRTVFFMPITVAILHLVAAFPMLRLILLAFGLANTTLFVECLTATAAVFAVIYFLVFRLTSRSYYKIVYR